jgi:small-conductance mechanosensitive channel
MGWRLLVLTLLGRCLWAQEAGVPVIVDGREVVRVYGSVGTFSAQDRVPEIERRIVSLGRKGYAGPVTTRPIPSENATAIVASSIIVMAVTDADAESAGVPREDLAQRYTAAIQQAIALYRDRHTWSSFLIAIGKTVGAWALFFLSAWGLWRVIRWLGGRLELAFNRLSAARGSGSLDMLIWERGRFLVISLVKLAAVLALISEFSFVISFTLGLFPQTTGISTTLLGYLARTFGRVGQAVIDYLPSGGFVVITAALTRYVLRVLKFLTEAIESGSLRVKGMHPEMARPTYQLARIVVLLFALILVFPYLPAGNSEAFKGVSIFLGLLLSLGSSSAVSNLLAGLVLTFMRPFRAGDRVKIADTVGDVMEKTLLVTRVHTIKHVEVVIPNGAILNNQILNYSALARSRGLILHTTVTIGYDAPWRTVHDLLIRAARATAGVMSEPSPFVLETALNDSYVSYELNAYTERANEIQNIYSHLHEAIQDSFNAAGVEIMSPSFYALRDGNTVTIPESHRPPGYEAPAFRVKESKANGRAMSSAAAAKRTPAA